ncbi:hypothetical protein ACMYSL_28880 [Klebsiella sp. MISC125]|uniref:hypothetical protein n=1 Tax=Klebsiella sp. MISC125 TaxID=2755386 RepID=UPI003DAA047A
MSTFNTRRDRTRDGKAKPHKHTKCASLNGKWHHPAEGDSWPRMNWNTPGPHDWKRLYTTLYRRANDHQNLRAILSGTDPEGMNWCPDNYPDEYYY